MAHFRDVGLLPQDRNGGDDFRTVDTGPKVIYIAPMKALAQEVVEKFSEKLKPMRLIVRELTGDMQLTRAEAESANVIVTVSIYRISFVGWLTLCLISFDCSFTHRHRRNGTL